MIPFISDGRLGVRFEGTTKVKEKNIIPFDEKGLFGDGYHLNRTSESWRIKTKE